MGGRYYTFVIVDDYTRFTWVLFLAHKDEAFEKFEAFCKRVQLEKGYLISKIRSNHWGEFENKSFEKFCNQHSFSHNFSALKTPQQNEVVEIQDMAKTMLIDNNLPKNL